MFERNYLADFPYPIGPQNVHLYVDLLKINIYVYTFSDDEGTGQHRLFIIRKVYQSKAKLLYLDKHYAPISNIAGCLYDITIYKERKNICRRCLKSFCT